MYRRNRGSLTKWSFSSYAIHPPVLCTICMSPIENPKVSLLAITSCLMPVLI